MFKTFKDDTNAFKKCPSTSKCDPAKLTKHFRDHFKNSFRKSDPKELEEAPRFVNKLQNIKGDNMRTEPPTSDEIQSALKRLKPWEIG